MIFKDRYRFQSPRGDFGFLKLPRKTVAYDEQRKQLVSIPSRGFWFFEAAQHYGVPATCITSRFQSPRGDFGFLKIPHLPPLCKRLYRALCAVRFY